MVLLLSCFFLLDSSENDTGATSMCKSILSKRGPDTLERYFTTKPDGTMPFLQGAETLAEGLAKNEFAQLQSVDNITDSRKGDEKRAARMNELMLEYPELGPKYDFMEGGIASLNVNKK